MCGSSMGITAVDVFCSHILWNNQNRHRNVVGVSLPSLGVRHIPYLAQPQRASSISSQQKALEWPWQNTEIDTKRLAQTVYILLCSSWDVILTCWTRNRLQHLLKTSLAKGCQAGRDTPSPPGHFAFPEQNSSWKDFLQFQAQCEHQIYSF